MPERKAGEKEQQETHPRGGKRIFREKKEDVQSARGGSTTRNRRKILEDSVKKGCPFPRGGTAEKGGIYGCNTIIAKGGVTSP